MMFGRLRSPNTNVESYKNCLCETRNSNCAYGDLAGWLAEKGPRLVHASKLPVTCQIWSSIILHVWSASAAAIVCWDGLSQLLWLDELALGQFPRD